ncbi:MAG: malonate transporter subunit MadL [Acidaminococcaceae bacterium]|jgi:malonate transporter MadL subunit|nr:malonate transporter subunit MadL [Acidaminococcaceae bacterium]HAY61257.1 malonate transporter subunit MadL [Acidaminococcaceae bacterium]
MAIYGVALLAACYIVGIFLGDIFGALVGVKANVGGVGFAMLFLILLTNKGIDAGWLDKKSQSGISFWSAMYIPIVVAMSSIQNVVAALRGGPLAIGGGLVGVAVAFAFIPIINKIFGNKSKQGVKP